MFAEVKLLIEGFISEDDGIEKTQPTISLIKDSSIIMVVDPGALESQQVLIERLRQEGLEANDVNYVCITHSHIDHYKNVGMFPKAKVLEYFGIWDKNTVKDLEDNFTENIRILKTPGHDYTSITLLVKTKQGNIAICGDVFWKENKPTTDIYAQDLKKLEQSRKLILDMADFVIPGHGAMYKVIKGAYNSRSTIKSIIPSASIFSNIKEKLIAKDLGVCRNCRRPFSKIQDQCICRQWLCYRCCECDDNCDLCNCSHKLR